MKTGWHKTNYSFWAISSFVAMFSKICLLQRCHKASTWGKGLSITNNDIAYYSFNPFPFANVILTHLQQTTFENSVAKGEILHNEQLIILPQCFKPVQWFNYHLQRFSIFVACCFETLLLHMYWKWKRVKQSIDYGKGNFFRCCNVLKNRLLHQRLYMGERKKRVGSRGWD